MFKRSACSAAVVAMLGALASTGVAAQEANVQKIERIEVTGSRIRQIDAETAQPVLKLTASDIQKTGLVTVGEIINQISSAGSPAFSKGSVLTSNREQGGQFANLRNLGAQRLLVLVNGRRWSQSVGGFTDLSTIPAAMIERVEVLKDGASSIYGSDAIAGVINFILKKSMDGGVASVYMGQNEAGDGKTKDMSIAYGASNEKASLMVGFTYNKVDPIWAKDREITATTFGPGKETAALGVGPWGRIRFVNPANGQATGTGWLLNHTTGANGLGYDGDGVGQSSRLQSSYHPFTGASVDLFNPPQQMMFAMGSELKSFFAKGSLDLSSSTRFNSTAMYAERVSARQVAGFPFNSLSQLAFPVYLDKDSYFNPYGNQAPGVAAGAGRDLFVNRRVIEVPRVTTNSNRTLHVDGSIETDFDVAGRAWTASATFNYSKVSGDTLQTGNLNLFNMKRAMGPSFLNSNGVVQCGTPTAPIPLTQCVPFDVVGGPSASNQAALDYVMHIGTATYGSVVKSYHVDASGELLQLPAGMMGLAVGLEQRDVSGYDRPGALEQAALTTDLAARTTLGGYRVKEGYLELNVPLLKGLPLIQSLDLNLASRKSDYSNFGNTTNSKASFVYRPIKDVLIRGTYAQGFRAPTLADYSGGGSQTFDSYLDPCDTSFGASVNDATVRARCAAAGVPANFRQRNQAGNPVASGGGQTPFAFNSGVGNDSLTPETATTKTMGFVYNPSQLPGLNIGVDWYRIQVDNRITAVSAGYVLGQCYVQGVQQFCNQIRRDATGQVSSLDRGNLNLGALQTEGFDLAVGYRFPATSYGKFTLRTESSYVKSYKAKSTNTSDYVESAGEYAIYRFKSNIGVDWSLGDFGATLGTRYYSPIKTQCWDVGSTSATSPRPPVECSNPTDTWSSGTGYNKLSARIYNDLNLSYKTPWKGTASFGINNLFNIKPRINYSAGSNFGGPSSSSSVDPDLPIDRFFYVRYEQRF